LGPACAPAALTRRKRKTAITTAAINATPPAMLPAITAIPVGATADVEAVASTGAGEALLLLTPPTAGSDEADTLAGGWLREEDRLRERVAVGVWLVDAGPGATVPDTDDARGAEPA
jgi:hypothetical protein